MKEPTYLVRREALAADAIAGDRDALVRLLELVRPDIRRFARQECRPNDVEDASQEALWQLYRRIGTLRAATALVGWAFTVVRRKCFKLARAASRDVSANERWFEASHYATMHAADVRLDVAAAIASLPAHYRAVVVLRDIEELKIDEIAAALNLSREAIKGRLHRARPLLREYLRERG